MVGVIEADQPLVTTIPPTAMSVAPVRTTEALAEIATRGAQSDTNALATAAAQATADARAAQATIQALATQGALVAAIATENAASGANVLATAQTQATQVAAIAAIATENAQSGANALATAQAQLAAAQTAQAAASANQALNAAELATAQAAAAAIQSTVAALTAQQAAAQQTATALAAEAAANALDPRSVTEAVEVDLDGLLRGDEEAVAAARRALARVLDPYRGQCRAGFVLISGHGDDITEGIGLAHAIETLLTEEFADIFGDAGSETFALPGVPPRGQVELQIFLFSGCPLIGTSPTPTATP